MTPAEMGWFGVWLFVGSVVVIAVEVAVMSVWTLRLARRGRALSEALQAQRDVLEQDVQRLRGAMEETRLLWRPYRRALRWLRHPLVIALLASYRRRWAAGRLF